MPRVRAVAGVGLSLMACLACTRPTPPAGPPRALRVLMGANPTGLDPHAVFDDVSDVVLANVYETLVRFDDNLQLAPGLAQRWINPDERTWRFFLDPRARFSDGAPLRAADVRASLERLRSLQGSALTGFVRHVAAVEVIDDTTVDIRTETPVAILNDLALIPIVRRAAGAGSGSAGSFVGSGPYYIARFEPERALLLLSNPHRPEPAMRRVEFTLRPAGFDAGDVRALQAHLALYPRRSKLNEMERALDPSVGVLKTQGLAVYYLSFNLRPTLPGRPGPNPLRDPRARHALDMALDRDALASPRLAGVRPAEQLVVPEIFGFDPSRPPLRHDLALARRLAREAGLDRAELHLDVPEQGAETLPRALLDQWQAAGIRISLRTHPNEGRLREALQAGRFDVTYEGYLCGSADASELLTVVLHSADAARGYGLGNSAAYSNAGVDRLAEDNLRVFEPKERLALLQRALRLAAEDRPYVPLVAVENVYLVSKAIRFRPHPAGEVRLAEIEWAGGT